MVKLSLAELAAREGADLRQLENDIASGRVIPLKHKGNEHAVLLGYNLSTKLNTNLGVNLASPLEQELQKVRVAELHGTDTVMDLSTKDTNQTLQAILDYSSVPVGTVPIYNCSDATSDEPFLKAIEDHVKIGASFLTIHAAITQEGAKLALRKRITKIVSRGGGILARYMSETGKENPLLRNFDQILDIMSGTGCALSIGDSLRPGCLADSMDEAMLLEMKVQGDLVLRSRERKVPVFCEGPGHMPFDKIDECMKLQKKVQHNAPYYVLGPLVTDRAMPYDHINAAIGATQAAISGVEFLCVLTPSEHWSLPNLEQIRDGVIAFKIAATAADVVKKRKGFMEKENEMAKARFNLDWTTQNKLSIPQVPVNVKDKAPCTMCLALCPMAASRKISEKEMAKIHATHSPQVKK
ncbi:Phosphomethylpyrimidine synthase [Candidatus Gugararchaeum adminiculabundum]|nr:Phosphomethylpyrimidine synthase [Candidatus Gugararchaeum adminiculabundum]